MVALIPLIVISVISYQQRIEAIQERSFNKIAAIRDLKIDQINVWLNERVSDIQGLANDPELKSLECLVNSRSQSQQQMDIVQSIREYLSEYVKIYETYYEAIA